MFSLELIAGKKVPIVLNIKYFGSNESLFLSHLQLSYTSKPAVKIDAISIKSTVKPNESFDFKFNFVCDSISKYEELLFTLVAQEKNQSLVSVNLGSKMLPVVAEFSSYLDFQSIGIYIMGLFLCYFIYIWISSRFSSSSSSTKKNANSSSKKMTNKSNKSLNGELNDSSIDVDMEWIPKHHLKHTKNISKSSVVDSNPEISANSNSSLNSGSMSDVSSSAEENSSGNKKQTKKKTSKKNQ